MRNSRKRRNLINVISFTCLSLFTFANTHAQRTKPNTEVSAQNTLTITGNVSDETGPLAGTNILLEGTNIGTETDFDGNFEFPKKLKKGDVLIFSFIGLETKKVTIKDENSTRRIVLKADSFMLTGEVAVKKVFKSEKGLWDEK